MAWLHQCLSKYKVKDLPLPPQLVTLEHPKQTLFDSIQVLSEHHLLSAPVVNSEGNLIGALDTLDIVAYLINEAMDGKVVLADHDIESLAMWVATVSPEDSLDQVGDTVAGPVRRSVVLDENDKPISVITQSTLVQFLHSKRDEIEALKSGGLAKDFCSTGVVTIAESGTALEAFDLINQKQISSLAIVDKDGQVLTVISATDLVVGLAHMEDKSKAMERLKFYNVLDFALAHRKLELKDRLATVSVSPDTPLQDVIEKLALTRVHRVVVMGDDRKPIGVVSLSDICRAVASPPVVYQY